MVKLFIDPGHGGKDAGATKQGVKEKDVTLKIALQLQKKLKAYQDVHVKLSRTTDKTISLKKRTNMANEWGADYLLSIHVNAGGGEGFESYIYNGTYSSKRRTNQLRESVHSSVVKETTFTDRGMKEANFHMLRESAMAACLTENGFIDTISDIKLLKEDDFLAKIAQGHVSGLVKAFQLNKSHPNQTYKIKKGDTLWSIARANDTTVANLKKLNESINPYQLKINSIIKVK